MKQNRNKRQRISDESSLVNNSHLHNVGGSSASRRIPSRTIVSTTDCTAGTSTQSTSRSISSVSSRSSNTSNVKRVSGLVSRQRMYQSSRKRTDNCVQSSLPSLGGDVRNALEIEDEQGMYGDYDTDDEDEEEEEDDDVDETPNNMNARRNQVIQNTRERSYEKNKSKMIFYYKNVKPVNITPEILKSLMNRVMMKIVPKVKFVPNEHLLSKKKEITTEVKEEFGKFWLQDVSAKKSIARDILSVLGGGYDKMNLEKKCMYWMAIRDRVLKRIRKHRSETASKMKIGVVNAIKKIKSCDDEDELNKLEKGLKKIISLYENQDNVAEQKKHEVFLKLRTMNEDIDVLRSYFYYFLRHVYSKSAIVEISTSGILQEKFTSFDEALVILLMMNNWRTWFELADGRDPKNTLRVWTKSGDGGGDKSNDIGNKGWDEKGMMMFNRLVKEMEKMKRSQKRKNLNRIQIELERMLLTEIKEGELLLKKGKKRNATEINANITWEGEHVPLSGYGSDINIDDSESEEEDGDDEDENESIDNDDE